MASAWAEEDPSDGRESSLQSRRGEVPPLRSNFPESSHEALPGKRLIAYYDEVVSGKPLSNVYLEEWAQYIARQPNGPISLDIDATITELNTIFLRATLIRGVNAQT